VGLVSIRSSRPPSISAATGSNSSDGDPRDGDLGVWGYFVRAVTRDYAAFHGRARRKEFWSFALGQLIVLASVFFVVGLVSRPDDRFVVFTILMAICAATVVPMVAVSVRRLHDLGVSGWAFLIVFIPAIGGTLMFIFYILPSQMEENKYGPVPAGVTEPD
jgi:uncharacterized membrane protein YhaH (DUF805 family)